MEWIQWAPLHVGSTLSIDLNHHKPSVESIRCICSSWQLPQCCDHRLSTTWSWICDICYLLVCCRVNCSFYFKIGACRHGDRCSRMHNRPTYGQTILLQNLFLNPQHATTTQSLYICIVVDCVYLLLTLITCNAKPSHAASAEHKINLYVTFLFWHIV